MEGDNDLEDLTPDDILEDLTPDAERDPDSEDEDEEEDSVPGRRHKRFTDSPDVLWYNGIVPYTLTEDLSK